MTTPSLTAIQYALISGESLTYFALARGLPRRGARSRRRRRARGRGSSRRRASRGTRRRPRRRRARRAPGRVRGPNSSISSLFGKCSSAPVSTTPADTAFTRIPRGRELDREVADERLERGLRGARSGRSSRARAARRATRSPRSRSRAASAARRRGRARAAPGHSRHRPVPVLVLGLERGADDAGRGVVDQRVERPERGDLLDDLVRGDVAADQDRLGAGARSSSAVASAAPSFRR